MEGSQFRTRAQLERQMDAARQLRAETLGGASWIIMAFAEVAGAIRRVVRRIASGALRRA